MEDGSSNRSGEPCLQKDFALRELKRRVNLLLCTLIEADDSVDLGQKLAVSYAALKETREVAAVLRRVIAVLERCKDGEV
ncbi:MAG: hypothetical protein AAGE85_09890 [Pseudomonadota bacterium]